MHTLLERQLRRAGFTRDQLPTDPTLWKEFLLRIERSYVNGERQRQLTTPLSTLPATTPLLEQALATISHGLCVFDNAGTLCFINPAAKLYLGLEHLPNLSSLLKYLELSPKKPTDPPITPKALLEHLLKGRSYHDHNASLQNAQAQTLPISCAFDPIIHNQKFMGLTFLFNDINEIKQVEVELRASKETAEKASQAKSQFLSSMSHELRTPMNAILGYSELLKEDLSVPLEEFQTEHIQDMLQYVGNILHAGWHLLELINKVLDLTRIEAGKLEVSVEKIELIDLIKDCLSTVAPQAEKNHITLHNQTESLSPHYAFADRGRLKQVLINLLSNAVKYNREAGQVTVNLTEPDSEHLHLAITDTGIGLSPEQKAKIFEPFTRLSGLNLIEGTGIGLTITKHLLEIMDSQIKVESTPGQGSTFSIELPNAEIIFPKIPNSQSAHHILLYIEDSRTNVSLVAQILKAKPEIALMSAHTGEMGLELAYIHDPSIILLDINLPGMDGFAVLKQLKEHPKTAHIPVLALTADDNVHNLDRGREIGFWDYIIKPLDIKKFLQTIDAALKVNSPKSSPS